LLTSEHLRVGVNGLHLLRSFHSGTIFCDIYY
jgi:hypothetical protein